MRFLIAALVMFTGASVTEARPPAHHNHPMVYPAARPYYSPHYNYNPYYNYAPYYSPYYSYNLYNSYYYRNLYNMQRYNYLRPWYPNYYFWLYR